MWSPYLALNSRTYGKGAKNFTRVAFHKKYRIFISLQLIHGILTRTSRTYKKVSESAKSLITSWTGPDWTRLDQTGQD